MFKRQYLNQNSEGFGFLIQTLDQAIDDAQRLLRGSNDQGVGSGIHHNVWSILGPHPPSRWSFKKIFDNVLYRGCIGMLEGINLD